MDPHAASPRFVSAARPAEERASERTQQLVEHFFRHESGRLVSVLARFFGLRHLELVEDMVQAALVAALQAWRTRGVPDNPSGWIHRVARNKVLDALRQRDTLARIAPEWAASRPTSVEPAIDDLFLDSQIEDSQLRLMFACCHPELARENQIALTLKSLGGFSSAEIARGLLVPDETIKKRIQRARRQLEEAGIELTVPAAAELPARLDVVHQCLYLMFNEGYAGSQGELSIREDVCEEAARLCHLLAQSTTTRTPATCALLALMLFHAARFGARVDRQGRVLLLEDQDRSRWDRDLIRAALDWLDASAEGQTITSYHLEAGIAWLHCSAPSFEATNWRAILRHYDALVRLDPSPVCRLNRAIVIAQMEGPAAGIREIEPLVGHPALRDYHLIDATLGELHRRAGDFAKAIEHLRRARAATLSSPEQELLSRRIELCERGASDSAGS